MPYSEQTTGPKQFWENVEGFRGQRPPGVRQKTEEPATAEPAITSELLARLMASFPRREFEPPPEPTASQGFWHNPFTHQRDLRRDAESMEAYRARMAYESDQSRMDFDLRRMMIEQIARAYERETEQAREDARSERSLAGQKEVARIYRTPVADAPHDIAHKQSQSRLNDAQANRMAAEAAYYEWLQQQGYTKGGKPIEGAESPLSDWRTKDLLDRRDELQSRLFDADSSRQLLEDSLRRGRWGWGLGRDTDVADVWRGGVKYKVPAAQREAFLDSLGVEDERTQQELAVLDRELSRRGFGGGNGSARVAQGPDAPPDSRAHGRSPSVGPTAAASGPAAAAGSRAPAGPAPSAAAGAQPAPGLLEKSWMEGRARVEIEMPETMEDWQQLDPQSRALYTILLEMQQQGFNVQDREVVQQAIARVKGGKDY